MVSDTLAYVTRGAHDLGLATWFGGTMFGKFALNPSVRAISERSERGKVLNAAWNSYNILKAAGLGAPLSDGREPASPRRTRSGCRPPRTPSR
jgi:putative copper export protein